MRDRLGAFVPGIDCRLAGRPGGPLAGLTFAAKDLLDVAGFPTGGGNPDWNRAGTPAGAHAWAVAALLEAGAELVGKTVTDEVSLGILGENAFYGTPANPRAPDRVPGGSSSGSAAAVAGGLADTALGTDTGGSVRIPASFCGLYGLRPTHGRLPTAGMMAQAPSSDTCGFFARDAHTFARVAEVLLRAPIPDARPTRLVVAVDAFGFAEPAVRAALAPMVERLARLAGERRDQVMAPGGLAQWAWAQRTLQSAEMARTFAAWIERDNPRFAFSVARNIVLAGQLAEADRARAALVRQEVRGRLSYLIPPGAILCLPTAPFPAPRRGLPLSEQQGLRDRITCMTCIGGLAGHPQLSLPGATVDGAPVGLSIVGPPGADEMLVAVARALEAASDLGPA